MKPSWGIRDQKSRSLTINIDFIVFVFVSSMRGKKNKTINAFVYIFGFGENSVLTSQEVSALPPEEVNVNRTAGCGANVLGKLQPLL